MVSPAKHPNAQSRKRDGDNKGLIALEGGLRPLDEEPPQVLIDEDEGADAIWQREIVSMIRRGVLKETDHTSCVHYCQLAVASVVKLSGSKLAYFARLKTELGLTPKARLNLSTGEPPKTSLADIMGRKEEL